MKKFILSFVLLLSLITAGCANANSTGIQASGQIEAKEIAVAPELSGRVVEVSVNEGDSVKAGDPLLRLDDSLLQSEKQAAQAAAGFCQRQRPDRAGWVGRGTIAI